MIQQKNQAEQKPAFLDDLQGEVSAESAPLLQFITKYAGVIAGFVIVLLLVVCGMGIWQWSRNSALKEAQEELSYISSRLTGQERDSALEKLAQSAPDSIKLFVYLSLGQSAQENGNLPLAARAYGQAAELDSDGAIGLAAALGGASSLLQAGDYQKALTLLRALESRSPAIAQSPQIKQMLAETAVKANDYPLAIQTYQWLAKEAPENDYFRARAEALEKAAK